jgi:hypothetical protein
MWYTKSGCLTPQKAHKICRKSKLIIASNKIFLVDDEINNIIITFKNNSFLLGSITSSIK